MTIAKISGDDLSAFLPHDDSVPVRLVKALPELLMELIHPAHGLSLERLQLTKIDIENELRKSGSSRGHFSFITLSKEEDSAVLSGELVLDDQRSLKVAIHYFIRGERKYLRQDYDPREILSEEIVKPITLDDVRAFFLALDQDNNFYYSESLAKLNGRVRPPIPSQMILAFMLARVFDEGKNFSLTFYHQLWPDQPIKLRKSIDDALCIDLVAEDDVVCRIETVLRFSI